MSTFNRPLPKALLHAGTVGDTPPTSSFVDTVYDQINAVLGGDNANQFLCLTIPGQALSAEDFAYDYAAAAPKGPTVEANESNLANKLFDAAKMTGADNGQTLPYQYRSALDALTPKLNKTVADAKNQLRELLLTKYPYDFGDGSSNEYTLQEVFFRLYDDWVTVSKKWAEDQTAKQTELKQRYPNAKDNKKCDDAYLTWFENQSTARITEINEKMSKVLSVFSPNDMKILEGILDSGSGAELEEARQTLLNTQKLTPSGGYVYPVKFNPTNWFELLDTSFTAVDLLASPDALATKMQSLSVRRLDISSKIAQISSLIPDKSTLAALQQDIDDAKATLATAQNTLTQTYGDGALAVFSTAMDLAPLFTGGIPMDILVKLGSNATLSNGKRPTDLASDLLAQAATCSAAQQKVVESGQKLADATAAAAKAQNLSNLSTLLAPLNQQLMEINAEIADLQSQITVANALRPAADDSGKVTDTNTSPAAVAPPKVPKGYTQVVISANASTMDSASSSSTSSSVSTSGVSFWFCGASHSSSSSSSSFAESTGSSDASVQIGMNVAKVGIEREWFNPGVFSLTKDMFRVTESNLTTTRVYDDMNDERLKDLATGNYIFPCFPTALVVARDISIKVSSSTSLSSDFSTSTENHASTSGGFLFFSGSSSSSSSSSQSGVHTSHTDNTVTLKFDTPQIIGYYLETLPTDRSEAITEISADDAKMGYTTISQFVDDYKQVIANMTKTNQLKGARK